MGSPRVRLDRLTKHRGSLQPREHLESPWGAGGGGVRLCLQTSCAFSASLGQTDRQTVAPPPTPPPLCSPPVPTVPPGNVHAEATNSTTIRFTWNAPSPQFINGINQGYKVREGSPGPGWKPARRAQAGAEGRRRGRVQEGIPAVSLRSLAQAKQRACLRSKQRASGCPQVHVQAPGSTDLDLPATR